MKYTRSSLLFLALIVGLSFPGCRHTNKSESTGSALENKIQGIMFIEQAARGCMLEIELGKLAAVKADHPEVRDFGKSMAADQELILNSLKELSVTKGLKLPDSLSRQEQIQVEEMRQMENKYFEKLYLKMMLENSRKYIELYRGTSRSPDVLISDFGKKYLPILEKHLQKAFEVQQSIS
ncbi:MAG: DUF4142 domain-containing protein [Candidatus Pedobacter colombiensis]|uniref:DUF4142 domain-containing protein n=1 Tax=Candidatus Pedobacter colombiensis TaxID=3121371 RepID=A0AAJ5WBK2_9SPHI|nr:DUF4142 domain-containing protein [Pedobacter sp.]WEK21013.1 MAG: DUF4142 domain-containing protein [Pedobacter sp.]